MIVFASAMTDPEAYRRYARPGISMAAERDSKIHAFAAVGSVCRSYNLLLERAALEPGLEALVLVQQDVEILDPNFCGKVRRALDDPEVAVVGPIGATGVRSIAWWDGQISSAAPVQRYQRFGSGEIPAFSWKPHDPAPAEVDVVDGRLMVLSPWAVETLRFDESLSLGYGYELDLCLKARAAGRRVMTADLHVCVPDPIAQGAHRHRPLDRGPHPGGREARGQASRGVHRRGGLEGARAPGRGRA